MNKDLRTMYMGYFKEGIFVRQTFSPRQWVFTDLDTLSIANLMRKLYSKSYYNEGDMIIKALSKRLTIEQLEEIDYKRAGIFAEQEYRDLLRKDIAL